MSRQKVNPFKAGAGHSPPYLAGRGDERDHFAKLLDQQVITQNLILTGLRGVGKTVLLDDVYKPLALKKQWIWVGSDLSESAFVDERALCMRMITDLSVFTSQLTLVTTRKRVGYRPDADQERRLSYEFVLDLFDSQPGLMSDKLKATLEFLWSAIDARGKKGVIFAYDEAQVVQDRRDKDQYPLALMLEVFQSLQRKDLRYMLVLTGLPTLYQRLVESRTYAERMFVVQQIGRLDAEAGREAITRPLRENVISFPTRAVADIIRESKCYPYFVQFYCREAYDYLKTWYDESGSIPQRSLKMDTLVRKLDADFFFGRWNRASDRLRELLTCIASLKNAASEFTVREIVTASAATAKIGRFKPFTTGDVNQALRKLIEIGLVYKNRYGKYSMAVPMFEEFVRRRFKERAR